jgi:hypothetical protein
MHEGLSVCWFPWMPPENKSIENYELFKARISLSKSRYS